MDSIPTLNSSSNLTGIENQPKAQTFKPSKIQTIFGDQIMFDSEFDLSPLINFLPKREMIDSAVNNQIWEFDQIISQIVAEKTVEDRTNYAKNLAKSEVKK